MSKLRVKEICKKKGLALNELAEKLGIGYRSLHVAISGNPKVDTLEKIAAALGVEVSELFSEKSIENSITCPFCNKKIKIMAAP